MKLHLDESTPIPFILCSNPPMYDEESLELLSLVVRKPLGGAQRGCFKGGISLDKYYKLREVSLNICCDLVEGVS